MLTTFLRISLLASLVFLSISSCPKISVQPCAHLCASLKKLRYKNCHPAQDRYRTQHGPSLCPGVNTLGSRLGECLGASIEMKSKGQETMRILRCHLGHAQENQSPKISCWNTPQTQTSLSEPFLVQGRDIVVRQGPNDNPSTRQHVPSSST